MDFQCEHWSDDSAPGSNWKTQCSDSEGEPPGLCDHDSDVDEEQCLDKVAVSGWQCAQQSSDSDVPAPDEKKRKHDFVTMPSAPCTTAQCHQAPNNKFSLDATIVRVAAGSAVSGSKPKSKHAQNGVSQERINAVLASDCGCNCGCYKKFTTATVHKICELFYSMDKIEQDALLQTLDSNLFQEDDCNCQQSSSSDNAESDDEASDACNTRLRRTNYHFEGERVCSQAFRNLLGIGKSRQRRLRSSGVDLRYNSGDRQRARQKTAPACEWIDIFLSGVYLKQCEPLPESKLGKGLAGDESSGDEWQPNVLVNPVFDLETILHYKKTKQWKKLLPKYLPPGAWFDLFYQAKAAASLEGVNCPSPSFFKARVKSWRSVLKKRKRSQHGQCKICWRLMQQLRRSKSMKTKMELLKDYDKHLQQTWLDRVTYWCMRSSAIRWDPPMLVVSIDSMDHSKFPIPRMTRIPKSLDNLHRPMVTVSGSLVHGIGITFYLSSEQVGGGINFFGHCLYDSLQWAADTSQIRQKPFPHILSLHTDNTTGQNKNYDGLSLINILVSSQSMSSGQNSHLQVGHTHEDLDQIFSILTSCLTDVGEWQSMSQLCQKLEHVISPILNRRYAGFQTRVVELKGTMDFKSWCEGYPAAAHFYGGFKPRKGKPVPHLFLMKPFADLTQNQKDAILEMERDVHSQDTICLVKHYSGQVELSQPPFRTFKHGSALPPGMPPLVAARRQMSNDREMELKRFSKILREECEMFEAAAYYDELVAENGDIDIQVPAWNFMQPRTELIEGRYDPETFSNKPPFELKVAFGH